MTKGHPLRVAFFITMVRRIQFLILQYLPCFAFLREQQSNVQRNGVDAGKALQQFIYNDYFKK